MPYHSATPGEGTQAVEDLRDALARMSIFRASTDAVVAFSPADLRILSVNPRTETLFGYRGTDLIGQPVSLLLAADTGLAAPLLDGQPHEVLARRADGTGFPADLV